jgi:hypothetical protein
MTKKPFEAIAEAMARQKPADHWDANKHTQWNLDVNALADMCAAENPNFDRARFLRACGV